MKKPIIILAICAAVAGGVSVTFVPIMRVPPPEEDIPVLAAQELRTFKLYYDVYKSDHNGTPPESIADLLSAGKYLRGVVEPHRSRILSQLQFPLTNTPPHATSSNALAVYRVAGFGDFFLYPDGGVVEVRLPGFDAETFRRIQKGKLD